MVKRERERYRERVEVSVHPCLRRPQERCQRERVRKWEKKNERERGREREQPHYTYGSRDKMCHA